MNIYIYRDVAPYAHTGVIPRTYRWGATGPSRLGNTASIRQRRSLTRQNASAQRTERRESASYRSSDYTYFVVALPTLHHMRHPFPRRVTNSSARDHDRSSDPHNEPRKNQQICQIVFGYNSHSLLAIQRTFTSSPPFSLSLSLSHTDTHTHTRTNTHTQSFYCIYQH
jgi:hypothetical protein